MQWLWVSVVVVVGCGGDSVVAGFGMILGSGFLLMGFYFYFYEWVLILSLMDFFFFFWLLGFVVDRGWLYSSGSVVNVS